MLLFPCNHCWDLYGPIPGSRGDGYICWESLLEDRLDDAQAGQAIQYGSYEGKAYYRAAHFIPAHKRGVNQVLSPRQTLENCQMVPQRIGVE